MRVRWRAGTSCRGTRRVRWWGAAAGDPDLGVGARADGAGRAEVHQLVLPGAAGRDGGVLADGPSTRTSSTRPIRARCAGQRRALDHHPQPVEPLGDHLGGDELVDPVGGLGAGPGAVDERVGAVVGGLGHHLERALEVVVGLAREPDDDVGGDRQIVDGGPGRGQALEVALGGVAPVHGSQHPVAARLQRQVQVLAHRRRVGHGLDGLGSEVLRVGARVADPADALDRADRPQQVGEERPTRRVAGLARAGKVAPVAVDVLPEQGDLGDPVVGQRPRPRRRCRRTAG